MATLAPHIVSTPFKEEADASERGHLLDHLDELLARYLQNVHEYQIARADLTRSLSSVCTPLLVSV
jgi:hypothetical protein